MQLLPGRRAVHRIYDKFRCNKLNKIYKKIYFIDNINQVMLSTCPEFCVAHLTISSVESTFNLLHRSDRPRCQGKNHVQRNLLWELIL